MRFSELVCLYSKISSRPALGREVTGACQTSGMQTACMYLHWGPLPLLHEQDAAGHALHRQSFLAQLVHQRKKRYVLKVGASGNEDDNGKAPSSAPACTRVFSEQFRGIIKASHPHKFPLRRASSFHHFDRHVVRQSSCEA